jgi:hypothetical protein
MAPKKEQVFGGIGGIICISAIILAIVFGILWGEQRDKRKKYEKNLTEYNQCNSTALKVVTKCIGECGNIPTEGCNESCITRFAKTSNKCSKILN